MATFTVAEPFWDSADVPQERAQDEYDYNSWDKVVLAGTEAPGLATVTGKKCHRLDKKEAAGQDGAVQTHLGYQPAEVDITIRLWTYAQWVAWQELVPSIQPKPGKATPKPIEVYHPALAAMSIHTLYVAEIGLPRDVQPRGTKEIVIRCQEWRPGTGKNVTSTPTGPRTDFTDRGQVGVDKAFPAAPSQAPSATKAGP